VKGATMIYPIKVNRALITNYCYLVIDENTKDAVLIEPAWEMTKIEAQMHQCGAKLKAILITHHHFDHVHLAKPFVEKYNVPAFMSKAEIDCYGFDCPNLTEITTPDPMTIGSIKITPLFTPGHTKGSICYWIMDSLFTADTLFIEGCGMCVGKGADPGELFNSLNQLKSILPLETKIYPGHSYGYEPGQELAFVMQNNIYLCFNAKADFIAFRMRKEQKSLFNFK
jgi:hydroxyacylglutathione hydrolase